MRPHEGVEGAQRAKLPPFILRRALEHRAFAVHHFVVADRQDEVLREGVRHRERHLVMVELPVDRLAAHVAQRVVHPAHVPLEPEAEASVIGALRDARPGGGFLGDHDGAWLASVRVGVGPLQQLDRFEILVAAVLVGHPLTRREE